MGRIGQLDIKVGQFIKEFKFELVVFLVIVENFVFLAQPD